MVGNEVFSLIMLCVVHSVIMFWCLGLMCNHFVHYFIITELCTILESWTLQGTLVSLRGDIFQSEQASQMIFAWTCALLLACWVYKPFWKTLCIVSISDVWSPTFTVPNYTCLILLLPEHHGKFTNVSVNDVSMGGVSDYLKEWCGLNFFMTFSSKLIIVLSLMTFFWN
jgi:hypothetical protein